MPSPNPTDRWFFVMDAPTAPSHVAVMATFAIPDGAPETFVGDLVDELRGARTFATPFNIRLSHPSLKRVAPQYTELGDHEIDLDYHLRHSALPRPGGERQLGVLISRLFSRPLDPQRPLWETHIIEGLEGNRFAWFFKIHHGLMDGMGGMRRFDQMLARSAGDRAATPIWSLGPKRRSRREASPSRGLLGSAKDAAVAAGALAMETARLAAERVNPSDDAWAVPYDAPMSILNGRIGQQRRFATQSYDLDRILAIKDGFGVTVNDVFLALCSGALRRYLAELGALPDKSLTAGIPVAVRKPGDDESSNAISATLVSLRSDIDDPAERIRAIGESSRRAKENLQSLPRTAMELYGTVVFSPLMLTQFTGLAGRTPPPFNLLVSNVPGPSEELFWGGARMEGLWALSILSHGQALNISADSMASRFNVGILGDRDALPSLQNLALHMRDALEELEAALAASRPKRGKRTPASKA